MASKGLPGSGGWMGRLVNALIGLVLMGIAASVSVAATEPAAEDAAIAQSLAEMLRDARAIISNNQSKINDPEIGDKGLTAKLGAMMAAIGEVMDANQSTINAKGIGFKAFIPAVFGRLVGESFARLASGEAELKVTAPPELVRNRKARPDVFEENIIKTKLVEPAWPRGQPYSEMTDAKGRPAYRVMVPEYYAASCLTCHGSPKGEMD
ncbi:MAG: DUF3365 domain-containing protein, partial [Alphaproteobacteria bacterium]